MARSRPAHGWSEPFKLYREAIASGASHAAMKEYRALFEESIREFEDWLQGKELRQIHLPQLVLSRPSNVRGWVRARRLQQAGSLHDSAEHANESRVGTWRVVRRRVAPKISKAEKVLFPDDGLTKGEFAACYASVESVMLPLVRGRPIMMQRFPDAIDGEPIVQQRAPGYFPPWIKRGATVKKRAGGSLTHALINNRDTLMFLADQACITPHVWLRVADKTERPDQMIFDLDPPAGKFELARAAVVAVLEVLDALHLAAFVKTTGGKGLHVQVPLERRSSADQVRDFARAVAELAAARGPQQFTTEQRKPKRSGRVYLDVMRNAYGQTAVAPYAVRARKGAPVATPITWEELDDPRLTPGEFTLKTVPERVKTKADPWQDMARQADGLGAARKRLEMLQQDK